MAPTTRKAADGSKVPQKGKGAKAGKSQPQKTPKKGQGVSTVKRLVANENTSIETDKLDLILSELTSIKQRQDKQDDILSTYVETSSVSGKKSSKTRPAMLGDVTSSDDDSQSEGESDDDEANSVDHDDEPQSTFRRKVGDTVSRKSEKKVVSNKFIEFSELLPRYGMVDEQEYNLNFKPGASKATFVRSKNTKKILSFPQWLEACDVFIALFVRRAKTVKEAINLTAELLTYRRNISLLKRQGYNWAEYDRHFRKDQEADLASWAIIDQDLKFMYEPSSVFSKPPTNISNFRGSNNQNQYTQRKNNKKSSLSIGDGKTIPYGYCVYYHAREKSCTKGKSCIHKHECPSCEIEHPAFKSCPATAGQGQTSSTINKPRRQATSSS